MKCQVSPNSVNIVHNEVGKRLGNGIVMKNGKTSRMREFVVRRLKKKQHRYLMKNMVGWLNSLMTFLIAPGAIASQVSLMILSSWLTSLNVLWKYTHKKVQWGHV